MVYLSAGDSLVSIWNDIHNRFRNGEIEANQYYRITAKLQKRYNELMGGATNPVPYPESNIR